jgi:hypothetical protein
VSGDCYIPESVAAGGPRACCCTCRNRAPALDRATFRPTGAFVCLAPEFPGVFPDHAAHGMCEQWQPRRESRERRLPPKMRGMAYELDQARGVGGPALARALRAGAEAIEWRRVGCGRDSP